MIPIFSDPKISPLITICLKHVLHTLYRLFVNLGILFTKHNFSRDKFVNNQLLNCIIFKATVCLLSPCFLFDLKARTDTELASEKAWLDAEKVWLNHSEGFSPGRLIKKKNENADETACMVKLDHGGEVIEIDEEQISKVNQIPCQIV